MRRFRLWPQSLATRTALVVLLGLIVVQGLGLTIHALDRIKLQRLGQARDAAAHLATLYRAAAAADPTVRDRVIAELELPQGYAAAISPQPPDDDMPPMEIELRQLIRANFATMPLPGVIRPHEFRLHGGFRYQRISAGIGLPDGNWLDVSLPLEPPRPWHSPTFLLAFLIMTALAALLIVWAVRRLIRPIAVLAHAAETLGRDVNAPPLAEDGPTEVARAAAAFNTMASRIRRFVQDRTEMLTAIGHDLRTPITRLKLRAEFVEDDELRRKILLDLEEMEAMVSATLAFGRDAGSQEPVSPIDLAELLRTILDEAGDAAPGLANALHYEGPPHMTVRVRPLALKRALANLVANAVKYGESAVVTLASAAGGFIRITVEDNGPGVPATELERVFEPFHRVEASRNRETGGVGLGLPIARNILRAHGGDVTLANRPGGGALAVATLPA